MSIADSPIYKVGAVILHQTPLGPEVLIVRPKPKHVGEVPLFVLPRGSRQYKGADGQMHDARDAATAVAHADALEPLNETLTREIEEEAGVPASILNKAIIRELGVRNFASRSKGMYPIYWFVVLLQNSALPKLHAVPSDAMAVRWESQKEIETMAAHGEFSAGYVPVIQEAIETLLRAA